MNHAKSKLETRIYFEKRHLIGDLIRTKKEFPAKYYQFKREILQEDKSLEQMFRWIESKKLN